MVFTGSCHVGLKIKVKAGVKACSKEGPPPPPESGEAASEPADHGVVTNNNARMLKRKRLTPPGSPALNKRPPRGESPHSTTTANGEPVQPVEPLEPVPKKLAADLNAVNKQDVATKPEESVEPGTEAKLEKGIKALSNSNLQGDLQVSSGATAEAVAAARTASDGPKADGNASADVSVATGVQVSSSLATSSVMTQAEEEKHHTIPSHAGRKELFSLIYN